MPANQLYIKQGGTWKDAFTTWGVSFEDGTLSNLLSFPATKQRVSNESRLEHGKRVVNVSPRVASREISLEMHLIAPDFATFLTRLDSFTALLEAGDIELRTSWRPDTVYHLQYLSCTQFSHIQGLAKFILRLEEPNPTNRNGE
jgi:hypothetical protein